MLVLSRTRGERIWIGEDICVTVVDVVGSRLRIGIEAPKDVPVTRGELVGARDWDRDGEAGDAGPVG